MARKKTKIRSVHLLNFLLFLLLVCLGYWSRDALYSLRKQAKASSAEIENRIIAIASELRYPSVSSNDYLPVRGSGMEIDPSMLETPAYSGDSGLFDPELCVYRTFLSEEEKQLYSQVYENALACNTERFTLSVPVSESTLSDIVTAVYNDHPELFWLDTAYSFGYLPDGSVVSVTLAYNETLNDLPGCQWAFGHAAAQALASVRPDASEIEKERAIHDYLLEHVTYDTAAVMHQSAYSALVLGSSVCAGYCRAFQYLLQSSGICCYYCTGTAGGGDHAWNIVRIDGEYYNVDPSWNDTSGVSYAYFNVPDSRFSSDHTRTGMSSRLPACTSERMSFRQIAEGLHTVSGSLPTFQSLGFQPGDILSSISDYNSICRDFLVRSGTGTHEMRVVLSGQDLYDQVLKRVRSRSFVQDYAQEAASRLHLASSTISITLQPEQLSDGYILLRQVITLTGTKSG